jgi:ABC-type transport system involved in multi-copper enzyme maturation permease subunit
MLQLLKTEWLKVKNYTTFWVLSILYLVSIFGANYIAYLIYDARPKNNNEMTMVIGSPFNFPDVWHVVSYTSSFLMFMPGLLMIISFTNEYSYKTHRQNIIDGWSRNDFIFVKILLAFVVAAVATFAVFSTALSFGLFENAASFTFVKTEFIGFFFIQCLSYCSAALLFSLIFKRSGITIGVYFLYTLILENMLAGFLNRYADNIGRYLPLETTDNLIGVPVFKAIVNQFTASYNIPMLLTMSAVYLALYYILSVRKFRTDDL